MATIKFEKDFGERFRESATAAGKAFRELSQVLREIKEKQKLQNILNSKPQSKYHK